MKNDIVQDLKALTFIDSKLLQKLIDATVYSINESVYETFKDDTSTVTEVDIGIGTLCIQCVNDELKFKFMPSAKLRDSIVETIKTGQNNLELKLEQSCVDKITAMYKEIL